MIQQAGSQAAGNDKSRSGNSHYGGDALFRLDLNYGLHRIIFVIF